MNYFYFIIIQFHSIIMIISGRFLNARFIKRQVQTLFQTWNRAHIHGIRIADLFANSIKLALHMMSDGQCHLIKIYLTRAN